MKFFLRSGPQSLGLDLMYPIFFSVSHHDIPFAERVWEKFPSDWIYLYSKSGEEGAHMWDEISRRELPMAKILIVFWSKNYLVSQGCIKEIFQAKDLVKQGIIRPVVLRMDDTPISWSENQSQDTKAVFDALKELLEYRTSSPNVTEAKAIELVGNAAESTLRSQHPIWPRHDLLQTMRRAVLKDKFTTYPTVWVSGFNGVGRESIVREFNRAFVPNGRSVLIDVNEASLPQQLLMRISSEAFGAGVDRLRQIASSAIDDDIASIVRAIQQVFDRGDYVIFRHNRIIEENIELPEWLNNVVNTLTPATRCKLFIISQLPLQAERRTQCRDAIVAQRVSTLDEHLMMEFCTQLIGHFDRNPTRWTDPDIAQVVAASGGNLGFLVSLVRSAANLDDLDQIDALVAADSARLTETITIYVRWAFAQLRNQDDEQKTLLFLNDVTPCHIDDLEKAISPQRPMVRILGKLIDLGLVEREAEEIYRLTPLLANRLNRDLIKPELVRWVEGAMRMFAARPIDIDVESDEGHEYLRLESRIQAALLSDEQNLPSGLATFISASHWFQAGIRLYHRKHRTEAYRILKKAYQKRSEFSSISRVELMRYYCLSATRNRKYTESEDCIKLLDGVHTTKAIAAFLRADLHEYKGEFYEASKEYERALELNKGKDSRLERTFRPLIRCILATSRPDFRNAERHALSYVKLRQTVFSLMARARVYLHWKYKEDNSDRPAPDDIDILFQDALAALERHPGVGSAHFEMLSEKAEFAGDFQGAIEYMNQAVAADPRFELRSERWRLMIKANDKEIAQQVLREMDIARGDQELRTNWSIILPNLADIYARALRVSGQPTGKLNTFAPELSSDDIGRIISRSTRKSARQYLN